MTSELNFPLVTIGIITLNREWIIGNSIRSIIAQGYPHSSLYVVVVDGGSRDNTVKIAEEMLGAADFNGFEVVVARSNIPEARNFCIDKMRGKYLLFWDSDVIMGRNAVEALVNQMECRGPTIISAELLQLFFNNQEEAEKKIEEIMNDESVPNQSLRKKKGVSMGSTIISSDIFNSCRFNNALSFSEDADFSLRAKECGADVFVEEGLKAYDINVKSKDSSDIYLNMSISSALNGMRRKMKAYVDTIEIEKTSRNLIDYLWINKRYLVYLGYFPVAIITILGIWNVWFSLALPLYLLGIFLIQVKRRGIRRGAVSLIRGILVGIPMALLFLYYYLCSER